ncbi:hypothetical protein F5B17DRAFT_411584 [Nemania serpens]|nr:hypothetical protein F5B17DRAFT_411584 [Nemania serpens]
MIHYRCSQYEPRDNSARVEHHWVRQEMITHKATGPACLYQKSPDTLMALVPTGDCVMNYRFSRNRWTNFGMVPSQSGPSCVCSDIGSGSTMFSALVCAGSQIHEFQYSKTTWKICQASLPYALSEIRHTPHHRVLATVPIAVASQAINALGRSQNMEAIAFHASGAGWQDSWMILHWSFLT